MKKYNRDYKRGMAFLLRETRKKHLNIKTVTWVAPFSLELSRANMCLKFWKGVAEQERLHHIPFCESIWDVCFHTEHFLSCWRETTEGHDHWFGLLYEIRNKFKDKFTFYGW